ncbi:sigma-70 family RNA polymerase sigma factor [Streptomyces sp. MBT33]|uniref:sigma-70 family RNA polymerase sigma factor n=1 Tax=Streptomyces sp. MBT33 TaxID=1488363 RepID=UPI00190E0CFF|nr:sigma-70 family RNA polymerase sigma factor [Streptomyces sp. MBT33]MBK3647815.1 sigma-70 family RNA polymerase sigma factor [Streptomyces sp. MBT33]
MSIVAERPVSAQVADRPEGTRGGGRRGLAAAQAERVGRLATLHHRRLVHYLFVRVDDWQLAEDLVQDMWLDLAMRPYEMDEWAGREDADLYPLLAWRAKRMIHQHLRLRRNELETVLGAAPAGDVRSIEQRLDALAGPGPEDATHCAVEELLGLADTGEISGCWSRALDALSPRQRQVIELLCEGMTQRAVAARMGDSQGNVGTHLRAALKTLRDPAEIARRLAKREAEALPGEWAQVIGRLPAAQAEVVRLRARGLSNAAVARELGRTAASTYEAYKRAVRSLRLMVQERRMDPVQAAPAQKKGAGRCARVCATGCYLRTARTGAAA